MLYNAFDKLFYLKPQINGVLYYTPATMQQHASRTAEAAEVSSSIEAVLATLRAFDAEKCSISCTNIYFIQYYTWYSLTSGL